MRVFLIDIRVSAGSGSNRVNRGGSWINTAENCVSAIRNDDHPANRDNNLGVRLASSLLRRKRIVYLTYGEYASAKIMTRRLSCAGDK